MAHWHEPDPLKQFIGQDTTKVRVLDTEKDAEGSLHAVLQGERFEKQIHTRMPDGTPAADRLYPILPPTALQYPDFLKACTACGKCMESCPEKILIPAQREYEVYGEKKSQGKATMSFEMGYCRTNCHRCAEVCPTGAIGNGKKGEMIDKRTIRSGWAQFNSRTCITHTEGVPCDACARHCPTKAIVLLEKEGIPQPHINQRLCIGCGACEFYCPGRPKAIYVEGI